MYWPNITLCKDEATLRRDSDVTVSEAECSLEDAANYYCPWYYDVDTKQELRKGFKELLQDPRARAARIKEVDSRFKEKWKKIQQLINDFEKGASLWPCPVATDIAIGKSLVLDSNHTLVAIYNLWSRDRRLKVIEVRGPSLSRIFCDFDIIGRS